MNTQGKNWIHYYVWMQELEMLHNGKCPLMEWTSQASISSSNFENTSFLNVDVGTQNMKQHKI